MVTETPVQQDGKHKHKGVEARGGGGEEVGSDGWGERLRGDLQVPSLAHLIVSCPTFAGLMCLRKKITH